MAIKLRDNLRCRVEFRVAVQDSFIDLFSMSMFSIDMNHLIQLRIIYAYQMMCHIVIYRTRRQRLTNQLLFNDTIAIGRKSTTILGGSFGSRKHSDQSAIWNQPWCQPEWPKLWKHSSHVNYQRNTNVGCFALLTSS